MTHSIGVYSLALATTQADNGNPREQWIHLLPVGRFAARDGRGPWSVTNPAAIIEQSRRYAGTRLIPVDYEHQTDHAPENGKPAPAAGWIKGLQARADGIWGLVEWTAPALAALTAKEYRYLSPVFQYTPQGDVLVILRAALTNNPALPQLTALARAGTTMPLDQILSQLREALGLPPETEFPAILDKVRSLKSTASCSSNPDPSQFVPIGLFQETAAELQALKVQGDEQTATLAVKELIGGGHLLPHWEKWAISLCRANKPAFEQFVREVSPLFRGLRRTQTSTLELASLSVDEAYRGHGDDQLAICRALGHSPEDLRKYGGN